MIVCPWYFPKKKPCCSQHPSGSPGSEAPERQAEVVWAWGKRERGERGNGCGISHEYEIILGIYGIYMGYIWDIYGIYMGCIWDIYMGYTYMGYIVYVCLTFGDISWVMDIASLVDGFADSWEYQHQGTGFEHSSDRNFPKDWYFWEIPLDIFPP